MLADLRFACRGILRRPGHSALVVLTLALGLGINTVAFSSVNALVFRPFEVAGSAESGWIFVGPPGNVIDSVSQDTFEQIRTRATSFEAVAAEGRLPLASTSPAGPEQIWALAVSPDYFHIVPAPLVTGRVLSPSDRADEAVPVLLSERYWKTRWQSATPSTVTLTINGQRAAVLGVVADDFQGPGGIFEPHVWVPLDALPTLRAGGFTRSETWLTMVAKPREGVSAERASAEVDVIAASLPVPPGSTSALDGQYVRIRDGHPEARAIGRAAVLALAAVGLVLLIACFNVAGLVLARSVERQRELGLRRALGASQAQLTRLLLVEGLVLATIAGLAALLVAGWSEALLGGLSLPAPIPQRLHFAVDWRMVSFTAVMVLVATLVPALTPAWRLSRLDPITWVRGAGTGAVGSIAPARTRRVFVVLQTVGATVFLALAVLFVSSFRSTANVDPGFDSTHTAALRIDRGNFDITPAAQQTLVESLREAMAARPDVAHVALVSRLSFALGLWPSAQATSSPRDCAGGGCTTLRVTAISPGFLDALSIPLLAGRDFSDADSDRTGVLINRAAADVLWPGQQAVGQWIHLTSEDGTRSAHQVQGVVGTIVQARFSESPQPALYRWFTSADAAASPSVVVRHRVSDEAGAALLRDHWQRLGDHTPPVTIETLAAQQALPLWPVRVSAAFFATCGIVAVVLVMVGLFGMSYFSVAQRTREFGVRLALGATNEDLRRLVLGETLRLTAPGLAIGLLLAVAAAAAMRAFLVGASPLDPRVYALTLLVQVLVILAAAWLPAHRASRTSPQQTMRSE